jgi:SAM-dependent MidA family methyltransferase
MEGEPPLSRAEADHTARVQDHIGAAIAAAGGWIGFETYMNLALYAPGLGYYSAGAHKLGFGGDFTTAPEMSRLFGGCVARQCAAVLAALGGGDILEIGAGTGRLAADLLLRLEALGALPERYAILEISADLRARQLTHLRARAPHLAKRVTWLDAPPERPFAGVAIANEVLDALPVARFRWSPGRIEELGVAGDRGRFVWAPVPAGDALAGAVCALAAAAEPWDAGYVSEFCPRLADWSAAVTRNLAAGAVLWFDYGLPRRQYYLPERHEGTLICHFRQRAHADPFALPGLQDITAWVDFTALAEAGLRAGFAVAGFTTQSYFLAGSGIDAEMHDLAAADPPTAAALAREARWLVMPGEMGERFKGMAWLRGMTAELAGFALRDLRHVL